MSDGLRQDPLYSRLGSESHPGGAHACAWEGRGRDENTDWILRMLRPRMRLLAALRPAEIRLRREYEERCQQIRRAKRGRERRQALDEARCEMIRARDELYERAVG